MLSFYKKHYNFCRCSFLFAAIYFHIFICSHNHNVISQQEEVDLDLFTSNSNRVSVFSKLDKTETLYGKAALQDMLRNPLSTIEDLNSRQEAIKYLVNETALFNQINNELLQFKMGEEALRSFQEVEDPISKAALNEFFFKSKLLKKYNNSPAMLNAGQLFTIMNLCLPLVEHITLHFLLSEKFKQKYNIGCCGSDHKHSHGENHDHGHDHKHHHDSPIKTAAYNAYNIAHLFIHFLNIKELIGHVYQKINLIKELQKKLIATSKCIKSLKRIYHLIALHPTIHQTLPHYSSLHQLLNFKIASKFDRLVSLLSQNTFNGTASRLSNYGKVLAAHAMMKEIQTELAPSLQAIGEVDAHISIAKLYKETQEHDLKYSFACFINNPTPIVDAKEFWNPMLQISAIKPEQFDLGIINPAHIIITGLNAAGKSTRLRSITLLVFLGQTITIVPSSSFTFTPFAKISTFIQHADNLSIGDSLFTNEVNKANNLILELKNLPKDQFCFIVFDELFKSTAFEHAQESAFKLMNYISNFQNATSITATHFPLLTTLADTKPENFKNYNAQVLKDETGNLNFIFKEGISDEKDAFKVLAMRNIGFDWNK